MSSSELTTTEISSNDQQTSSNIISSNIISSTLADIPDDFIPVVYEVPNIPDIFKFDHGINFIKPYNYPKFSYGFNHFFHQTKDKTEIFNKVSSKNKAYQVINKFEQYVDDYNMSIGQVSDKYFKINPIPAILSRAILKLWELIFMFDLIDVNKSNFVSAHLAEGPGSFIQATMFYRDKFSTKAKQDKYIGITLHSENSQVPALEDKFIKYYDKENPKRFYTQETYPSKIADKSTDKTNGDLTKLSTIDIFNKTYFSKNKADLVTADGGFPWKNETFQEQEAFVLILAETVAAITIQADKGSYVCKIYETFTEITVRLIAILKSFYSQVYITKPLTSRASNSEKYLVCKNFKENPKALLVLRNILQLITDSKHKDLMIGEFFPKYEMPKELKYTIINMNSLVSNTQYVILNKMIDFINKKNYRGSVYQESRDAQIEASKFWINMFYIDKNKYQESLKKLLKFTDNILARNKMSIKDLEKHIEL